MDLNSILVSEFAKITNDDKKTTNEGSTVYGTYRVQNDEAYVQIDGSDTRTPVATTSEARNGDRVTVLIKNHRAIVTGNLTDPSASSETVRTLDLGLGGLNDTIRNVSNSVSDLSGEVDGISTQVTGMAASIEGAEKVATNFLSFEDPYGLIVGDLTGSTLGFNVLIDATSVNMRYNSTVLAKYASNTIYLGYNSRESIIDMCNGLATIGPDTDYINRLMIKADPGISLDASSGPIGIMGMRSLLWLQNDGIFLLSNPTQDPGNGNDSSNVGFYLDNSTREINVYGTIVGYSKTNHTHSGYAPSSHTHSQYYESGDNINVGSIKSVATANNTCDWAANMYVGKTYGEFYKTTNTSTRAVKHDIKPIEKEDILPEKLYDAEVIQFIYNDDQLPKTAKRYGRELPGFIVDDLVNVYPTAVDIDEDGKPFQWNAQYLIPPMLALIQKQKIQLDSLESRLESLEKKET